MGTQVFRTVGGHQFNWPTGVDKIKVELWGGGASGGGSQTTTYGGAGASACYVEGEFTRPTDGISYVDVGPGGAAVPSNSAQDGYTGGFTRFYIQPGPYNISSEGAGGGQPSLSIGAGGDGGAGGVYAGPDVSMFILGGQGQASMPDGGFPMGANAPRGGCGGNNNQDGMQPGGGGAPASSSQVGGKGGDGMVIIRW